MMLEPLLCWLRSSPACACPGFCLSLTRWLQRHPEAGSFWPCSDGSSQEETSGSSAPKSRSVSVSQDATCQFMNNYFTEMCSGSEATRSASVFQDDTSHPENTPFHRGEYFWEIRFRGSPIRCATKITTHLLWDVTERFTCVVIFVETLYFSEVLAAMRSFRHSPNLQYADRHKNSLPITRHRMPPGMEKLRSRSNRQKHCHHDFPRSC